LEHAGKHSLGQCADALPKNRCMIPNTEFKLSSSIRLARGLHAGSIVAAIVLIRFPYACPCFASGPYDLPRFVSHNLRSQKIGESSGPSSIVNRRPDLSICLHVDANGTSQVPRRSIPCLAPSKTPAEVPILHRRSREGEASRDRTGAGPASLPSRVLKLADDAEFAVPEK
jgi:hypothetical protein